MIILHSEIQKMSSAYYFLETDEVIVQTNVIIRSILNNEANRQYVEFQYLAGLISLEHKNKIFSNMHDGVQNPSYFFDDPNLPKDQPTASEVIAYVTENNIPNNFEPTDTLIELINKLKIMGYAFHRNIKTNLL